MRNCILFWCILFAKSVLCKKLVVRKVYPFIHVPNIHSLLNLKYVYITVALCLYFCHLSIYEGESNENLKYFLSHNLLNTKVHNAFIFLCSLHCGPFHSVTWWFSFTMASTAAMASGVTTRCAWLGQGESVTELMPFMNFLVHSYICCSDRHASPYWTFICCKCGRQLYTTTTAPLCCIPPSYSHLLATLHTMSITVVNLQDSRA